MPHTNLQEFIRALEAAGDLRRIAAAVDPRLEITEIADRVSKAGGPALLFENVTGSSFPLLINAFGSFPRMERALNCASFDEIARKIETLVKVQPPQGIMDKVRLLFTLKDIAGIMPKKVKSAPCQANVIRDERLLDHLPILTCWPGDGGPFVTLPIVITKDPDTGIQNAGMYRMQKFDARSTGMHWQYNKDGARHYEKFKALGKRMEVAVALGGSPAVTYAASAPLPPDVDEMLFAGFLEGRAVELVKGKTVDLYVPAESDFVIEGFVDPGDETIEGPFGDHTGFYSPADTYPVFRITCITHRDGAVYPATIVGKPPMEDCYMAKATERIFLPFIKLIVPEISDINLPMEGVFHNCAFVSIKKHYPGQAKKVISALWGLGQMASTKFIAVFDDDIDLADYSTVAWKLLNNVDPRRDLVFSEGPLDALDHSAPHANFGGKMGIDATRKTREEGMGRDWPPEIRMADDIRDLVDKRWREYGL
ncbi:MAG TPA: menaquinone biosynthesis decarboxylase [Spirochaetota bacterium]|nr:menaquinone biosynthesis decarboxylase [Spirochaetota bacterium]HOS38159.1 menaquinone biosynthesis decarboxylase [Spirochaetota bacterium]HPU88454.1 menaquinone biosynthesis decarboxylase [Spirochaetota bacterium]